MKKSRFLSLITQVVNKPSPRKKVLIILICLCLFSFTWILFQSEKIKLDYKPLISSFEEVDLAQDKIETPPNSTSLKMSEADLEPNTTTSANNETPSGTINLYSIVKVVDGDTIDVNINGQVERLRLIGIDTPEVVDPRKPVQCFGLEASNRTKEILTGQLIRLESDPSQGERDKYGRLLRYVFLTDGTNFNRQMIKDGYAHEYTYNLPYKYQSDFKLAETEARENKRGLWGNKCENIAPSMPMGEPYLGQTPTNEACNIKGNINADGEKIYHLPNCDYYQKTKINLEQGERWFCSEQEALSAGWRKALNCH